MSQFSNMSKMYVFIIWEKEFAKSRAMLACVPASSTCQRAYVPPWFTCERACVPPWFTCQRTCVPTCQKRAKFSFYLPTCQTACHCFNLACQRAKRRANFSTWRANVSKGVPIFQTFLVRNAKENFCTLLLYKKLCILLDIIVIHIICICIINKNYIILYFYTSCHTKEKCVEFFFFIIFFFFAL